MTIAKSIVPGAGQGMTTTEELQKNRIVITYMGIVKPHFLVKKSNKNIFSLGILNTHDPIAIMIDPMEKGNAARFINCAYDDFLNCKVELGIYQPTNGGHAEPAVIIRTIKKIPKGW